MTESVEESRAASHAKPAPPTLAQKMSPFVPIAALVVALAAIGVAIWALVAPPSRAHSVAGQDGDPKTEICAAFNTVANAVSVQTHADLGPDPVAQKAVAANARLAMIGGGDYLLNRLGPATPPELADAVRSFANDLVTIGMNALAEVPASEPAQAARLNAGEARRTQIAELCK